MAPFTVFVSHTSRLRTPEEVAAAAEVTGSADTQGRHKARKGYLTEHLLPALAGALARRGGEAWIDKRAIRPGEEFEPAICVALARCDAVVVLVDRDALTSRYMADEALLAGWRRIIEPELQVLPVLVGDVTEKEFAASALGAAGGLAALSCLVLPIRAARNGPASQQFAAEIVDHLHPPVPGDRVAASWVADIAYFLQGVPPHALDDLEQQLGILHGSATLGGNRLDRIAAALLHSDLGTALGVVRRINDYLMTESKVQVVRRVVPLWVGIDPARRLMAVSGREPERRTVGLGTDSMVRAEHAVQRASAAASHVTARRLTGSAGEEMVDELVQRHDDALRTALRLEPDDGPEYIREELAREKVLVFALLPCAGTTVRVVRRVVRALVQSFPGVVFVLVGLRQHEGRSERLDTIPLISDEDEKRRTRRQIRQLLDMIDEDEVSFDDE